MRLLKIKIHPLFWLLGAALVFTGNAYTFAVYVFTAVIHEYSHAFAASFFGCRTEKIALYPYGAVLYGEFSSLRPAEEIVVAAAGPALNLLAALVFLALWWVFPALYAYTDIPATVNLSIGLFNLLPVYPLDGGRILMSILKLRMGARKAFSVVRAMGIVCGMTFMALYIYSVWGRINYTLGITAVLMLVSILENQPESLTSVLYPPACQWYKKGVEVKTIKVDSELTALEMLRLLSPQYYYIVEIVEDGKVLTSLRHEQLEPLVTGHSALLPLRDIIDKIPISADTGQHANGGNVGR